MAFVACNKGETNINSMCVRVRVCVCARARNLLYLKYNYTLILHTFGKDIAVLHVNQTVKYLTPITPRITTKNRQLLCLHKSYRSQAHLHAY
jgi:hypothetical protein